jgi:DNA-binding transcriptional LysR family regulator
MGEGINRRIRLIEAFLVELKQIRCFVAVAESLHFGHAAARLRIAQPSLTYHIQRLEEELQTTLLHRTKRRVELTGAGRKFLEDARDLLARADSAALTARRTGVGEAGRIRVAVGYCMDHVDVSKAVGVFNQRHQSIRVELQTMAVPLQFAALRDDRLDVGFVRPPVTDAALKHAVLSREPMIVAMRPNHALASRATIALSSLANEPFVLPPQPIVPVYHDFVLKACREAGFVPNAPHEADHLHLALGMVAAGSGVALVPTSARRMTQFRLAFVVLRPAPPEFEVAVAWRRDDTSERVTEFLKNAREVVERSNRRSRA